VNETFSVENQKLKLKVRDEDGNEGVMEGEFAGRVEVQSEHVSHRTIPVTIIKLVLYSEGAETTVDTTKSICLRRVKEIEDALEILKREVEMWS
jgi:hypothetical protein